ncbi:hypothetical protein TNCV_2516171 [Trichonephila clavipes]|nr:hypothetical protein TNCV_2516171 [Trichonephila clavipes]
MSLAVVLSSIQVNVRFCSVPPQIRGRLWGWSEASYLSTPSTNRTKGFATRRLFRVLPCREGTIHLQIPMSSPGFEPSLYEIAVSVANHYTGRTTVIILNVFLIAGTTTYFKRIKFLTVEKYSA